MLQAVVLLASREENDLDYWFTEVFPLQTFLAYPLTITDKWLSGSLSASQGAGGHIQEENKLTSIEKVVHIGSHLMYETLKEGSNGGCDLNSWSSRRQPLQVEDGIARSLVVTASLEQMVQQEICTLTVRCFANTGTLCS